MSHVLCFKANPLAYVSVHRSIIHKRMETTQVFINRWKKWVYFTFLQYIMGFQSTFSLYYFICFPKISMRPRLPFPLYWLLRETHNGNGIDSFAIPPLDEGRASVRNPVFWFLIWCDFYFSIQWSGQDQITRLGGTFGDASYKQWTAPLFIVS